MMSRCPLVTGSKEPGHTTRRTGILPSSRWPGLCRAGMSLCGVTVPERGFAVRRWPGPRCSPRARSAAPTCVARSTTTSAPGASQPWLASAVSTAVTSSPPAAYGGSSEDQVPRAVRAGAAGQHGRHPAGLHPRAWRSPSAATLARITAAARGSASTSSDAGRAAGQRLEPDRARARRTGRASRSPASVPRAAVTEANSASRTRSLVGRVPCPRRGEPPPAGGPADDPGHRPSTLRPSPGTRPAADCSSSATAAASAGCAGQRRVRLEQVGRPPAGRRRSSSRRGSTAAAAGWTGGRTARRPARRPPGAAPGRAGAARTRPVVAATASSRSPGRAALGRLGDQQAQPACRPRPTRPRSWCSWETPNRSASMITMVVAFGTSTPTSMTVVATSTSISPVRERAA